MTAITSPVLLNKDVPLIINGKAVTPEIYTTMIDEMVLSLGWKLINKKAEMLKERKDTIQISPTLRTLLECLKHKKEDHGCVKMRLPDDSTSEASFEDVLDLIKREVVLGNLGIPDLIRYTLLDGRHKFAKIIKDTVNRGQVWEAMLLVTLNFLVVFPIMKNDQSLAPADAIALFTAEIILFVDLIFPFANVVFGPQQNSILIDPPRTARGNLRSYIYH